MKVYTEYQVQELLRLQRENCARVVEEANEQLNNSSDDLKMKVCRAEEPTNSPPFEAYVAQDMKRSFMAGYGAGFDAGTVHSKEDHVTDKIKCLNYLNDFSEWFCRYNKREENAGIVYQNDKTVSK
ncbi:hypothetical protein [Cesiribacter sp. SM1]|uniref:hypothetical protein n=1 Tax=Cesiribacter sp. SM1 TaxID=2861196 RepID=UPI001CD31ACD|nr:hypothetical protein [Cesiribacter sp. SM1]